MEKDNRDLGASRPSADRATLASPQAPSGLGHSEGIADAVRGAESIVLRWLAIEGDADRETDDEAEDGYNLGVRDGFQEAVQIIDQLTGGDGEYRYCTNHDPERHCPDPVFMVRNILERFHAQRIEARSDETPKEVRPEGREPDGEADAPNTSRNTPHHIPKGGDNQ